MAESLEQKVARLEKALQRTQDVQEIQNVLSRHCFLDAQGLNREQVKEIWSQTMPDVSFIQNDAAMIGLNQITHYYCDNWEQKLKPDYQRKIATLFPDISKEKAAALAGWMKMHTNCSPYIIVAGDGKTAKGTWESPGFVTDFVGKTLGAMWIWERFALDFIKEQGKWKIWHFNALVQFMTPYEKSWVTSAMDHEPIPERDHGAAVEPQRNFSYDPEIPCGSLSPNFPKQPVPYETFNETFSYGP